MHVDCKVLCSIRQVIASFDQSCPTRALYGPYSGGPHPYRAEFAWQTLADALRADTNYGGTTVIHISARLALRSVSAQEALELQPPEISGLLTLTKRCAVTDEELELIEVRYQQALALINLEDLFADGQLDCMSSV